MAPSQTTPEQRLEKIRTLMEAAIQEDELLSQVFGAVQVKSDEDIYDGILLSFAKSSESLTLHAYVGDDVMQFSDDELKAEISDRRDRLRDWLMTSVVQDLGDTRIHSTAGGSSVRENPLVRERSSFQTAKGLTTGLGMIGALLFGPRLSVKLGVDSTALRGLMDAGIVSAGYYAPATAFRQFSTRADDKALAGDIGEPMMREGLKALRRKENRAEKPKGWAAVEKRSDQLSDGIAPSIARRIKTSKKREHKSRERE